LLVLDEPTNHLDIPAQEVLQDALQHFPGTILLVTHDRYLVDKLASEIWEIRDGWLHCYKGTYQDYLSEREAENETNKIAGDDTKADGKASWQDSRRVENESKRREKDIIQTEGLIHQMEARLEELSQAMEMASREEKWEDLQNLGRSYKAVEAELEALMMRWEALSLAE
jgi:ATP-binding cassette subfamily F protein 3